MGAELELKAADARAALAFTAALVECGEEAQLAARIEALAGLIGAESMIVMSSRDWMGEVAVEVGDPEVYSASLVAAVNRDWQEHPVMVPDLAAADLGARRLSDFVALRSWRRGDLFNDFYRPLGMPYELSVQLAWGPVGSSCCVALHRGGRDFGPRDQALLELVAPYLRAARVRVAAGPRTGGRNVLPDTGCAADGLARSLPITPREAEVLSRLAAGRTNEGIAYDLGISRHTVVRHVEHIYAKLGVHTRAAATRVALGALIEGG